MSVGEVSDGGGVREVSYPGSDLRGYFQYGGSTHCLVFRPGAIAEFALAAIPQPHDPEAPLMLVRSKLAVASPAT
ncbi:MAG TPA: hypothetical protein VHZ03_20455 [Trebonia sp.]|nr:hypothetical protein [Trebonia sp.]